MIYFKVGVMLQKIQVKERYNKKIMLK